MQKRMRPSLPTAFTLVEVLVVVGVIGILVGLLLPAVQSVREVANRVKCSNNLKHIGLASLQYESHYGTLPPARLGNVQPSWAFVILPWLDQENLFRAWDFSNYDLTQLNTTVLRADVPIFYCPSIGRGSDEWRRLKISLYSATCGGEHPPINKGNLLGTPGDYAACVGTTDEDRASVLPTGQWIGANGAVAWVPNPRGSAIRGLPLLAFKDGLSNTLLIGEKHIPASRLGEAPFDCSLWDGHIPTCNVRAAGVDYPLAFDRAEVMWSFGSPHPSVCQFVFCDGSVHPLDKRIDPITLGLLANRHDGLATPDWDR